jgi:hypothetical protein
MNLGMKNKKEEEENTGKKKEILSLITQKKRSCP